MFYLEKSGNSESPDSVANMSKSDILRGIITEKLSTAAREILAVVERTVADYEEEAAGFRQEIDRQRRLLELLQPRVKLERTDLDIHEVVVMTGDKEDQQHTHLPGMEGPGSPSLLRRDEDEDEQRMAQMSMSSRQKRENLMHPDYEIPRKKSSRHWLSDTQRHLNFRICFLEDSQDGFKKTLFEDLKCPRDLKEGDFLDMIKSTFPQLAGDKPLNIFKSDHSKRLQRLMLKTLTPEDIYRTTKPTGLEKAVLYVKLKTGEEDEEEELHLLPTSDKPLTHSDRVLMKGDEAISSSVQQLDYTKVDVMANSSASQLQLLLTKDAAVNGSSDDKHGVVALNPELQVAKRSKAKELQSSSETIQTSTIACKVCGLQGNQDSLIQHAWSHVDESPAVCGICGERFESVETLKGHLTNDPKYHNSNNQMSLQTEAKQYKCETCAKSFGLKEQLEIHCKEHAGLQKYHCNICGKALSHLRSMRRHKLTHTVERPHSCEVCGKHFRCPHVLNSHKKIHTVRERPYLCHICCKSFMSNSVLSTHMKIHSNERPHICLVCKKAFIYKGSLKAHMRMHTGEKPYSCSQCGRSFKHKCHLNDHVRSHSGIKQFVCSICGRACSRQTQLKTHMRTHNGEKPYQCDICKRCFSHRGTLKSHVKIHEAKKKDSDPPENQTVC
uniref:zinc finger protein 583 n=1 Tax=Maylandia zebra TaxID=106582 RepID=UPI000D31D174|nr:zinc finger protein 583 [Maylandia zebra]